MILDNGTLLYYHGCIEMADAHHREISEEIDYFLERLSPLARGQSVTFVLSKPSLKSKKSNQLIVITPGAHFGFRDGTALLSVVGSGSVVIDYKSKKVADLVRAGIPAKLASGLMDKLNLLFKDR